MTDRALSVRLYGLPVGILEEDALGQLQFTYADSATHPLSMGMPLDGKTYGHHHCEAFFGGLLPESALARKALGKLFGVSPDNTFSLLREIGYDCAGAVSLHRLDAPVNGHEDFAVEGRILSDGLLVEYINDLPRRPLFIGVDDLRLSLAGVQDKAAVCLIDGQVAIPKNECPTTHILKPAIERFTGTVFNEYFCMRLAKRLGLNVATVEIRMANDIPYLLVERYDRRMENNRIRRIHQEDFCQALGVLTSRKYQNEGGPGFKACFDLLRETTTPVIDRTRLAQGMVFNYLIGNTDAHGKNFSLLHLEAGETQLAPLYDALSTRIYKGLSKKMAMKIGSQYELDYVETSHWKKLCQEIGYSFPLLKENIITQAEAIIQAAKEERDSLENILPDLGTVDTIISFLESHCNSVLKKFLG